MTSCHQISTGNVSHVWNGRSAIYMTPGHITNPTSCDLSICKPAVVNINYPAKALSMGYMDPFPLPLFPLICSSLLASTLALIFVTFILTVSPVLWILPAAFISTIAYHAVILLISTGESPGSARLFSLPNLVVGYVLVVAWLASFGVGTALTTLVQMGKFGNASGPKAIWRMILPCLFAFFEFVIMGFIVERTQKERRRILYAAKWKWRPGHGIPSQSPPWSSGVR